MVDWKNEQKEVKEKDDIEAIKKASEELTNAAQAVGTKMYQAEQASTQEQTKNKSTEPKNEEGPIDAEFQEKNEE